MAISPSCSNSLDEAPSTKREPIGDPKKDRRVGGRQPQKDPKTKSDDSGSPSQPIMPPSNPSLGTSISTSSGPIAQSPVSAGGGSSSPTGSNASSQTTATDTLTTELVRIQDSLAVFAALVTEKAPAAKDPVNDAQRHISTAVANSKALISEKDESRKAFLDAQIKMSISLSRVAISRGFTAGWSQGTWPSDVDRTYRDLVKQYEVLYPNGTVP